MKFKIYLDYQGTLIENGIDRCNFGCMEVIEKLQKAGHEIILNTSHVEDKDPSKLNAAMAMVNEKAWLFVKDRSRRDDFELEPIPVNKFKYQPEIWDWKRMKSSGIMTIDDYAIGIPLKLSGFTNYNLVDWSKLDTEFEENGMYIQE